MSIKAISGNCVLTTDTLTLVPRWFCGGPRKSFGRAGEEVKLAKVFRE